MGVKGIREEFLGMLREDSGNKEQGRAHFEMIRPEVGPQGPEHSPPPQEYWVSNQGRKEPTTDRGSNTDRWLMVIVWPGTGGRVSQRPLQQLSLSSWAGWGGPIDTKRDSAVACTFSKTLIFYGLSLCHWFPLQFKNYINTSERNVVPPPIHCPVWPC